MDKEARNLIQRATQSARRLLEQEYREQLEGTFDILLDGSLAGEAGEHLNDAERLVREKLVATLAHKRATGLSPVEAVASYLREAAFTTLNRLVALKMLEARGLVQQCLSRGEESSGFKEFIALAPGLGDLPDKGFKLYIETIFDEIGQEVRVLFDRRDGTSLLWPRRQGLQSLLAILNQAELDPLWSEDETIGWVYQFFNGDDERRKMREESQAPRNSHELAVRNQFFTPRYVVQFLTDNTLGRTWYEMKRGQTRLQNLEYMVRRPGEFDAPVAEGGAEPRPIKDPRELKVLDPACGSGHFLLYAFDLLLTIYEEAWEDGHSLKDEHPTLEHLHRAVPEMILRLNLHGIDIDPRCVQIAALALWMRAQRAYNEYGVPRGDRPAITRTNLAVAEAMPGERELRQEFIASLDPQLGRLAQGVFEKMELAGEAGTLLRIETEMESAIRGVYSADGDLFRQADEERWGDVEVELLAALRSYAELAQNGQAFGRRLFAEDAARGLAFIDLCRQRYDVILMNPPFGAVPSGAKEYLTRSWTTSKSDLLAMFVERGLSLAQPRGMLGAITSRACFFLSSFQRWREDVVLGRARPLVLADLGYGVMDSAMVEAAAYCLEVRA